MSNNAQQHISNDTKKSTKNKALKYKRNIFNGKC
jgi:hypothetical protein